MISSSDIVDVAVGVIRNAEGQFLLAKRAVIPGRLYPGHWEFPGGKREPGETIEEALARELKEEIDIDIERPTRWVTRLVAYPHITVRLHFYRVRQWHGAPKLIEHSEIRWFSPSQGPPRQCEPAPWNQAPPVLPPRSWCGGPRIYFPSG